MTRVCCFLMLAVLVLLPTAKADVVVVVHPESPIRQLTKQQLSDLYLGRQRMVPDGERMTVIDLPRDHATRGSFFSALNGMNLSRVNAYWARLEFSGEVSPPLSVPDQQTVINLVRQNRLAIGYIDAASASTQVRALLQLH